jgi:hypothetical protein
MPAKVPAQRGGAERDSRPWNADRGGGPFPIYARSIPMLCDEPWRYPQKSRAVGLKVAAMASLPIRPCPFHQMG